MYDQCPSLTPIHETLIDEDKMPLRTAYITVRSGTPKKFMFEVFGIDSIRDELVNIKCIFYTRIDKLQKEVAVKSGELNGNNIE